MAPKEAWNNPRSLSPSLVAAANKGPKEAWNNPLSLSPSLMAAANRGDVRLHEGLASPPSHLPNVETIRRDWQLMMNRRYLLQGHRRGHSNLPIGRPQPGSETSLQRPKIPSYPPPRGSGMQAIFLDSYQKSPGTGFFFPQNGKKFGPRVKSGSHVALVPLRVIEALNKSRNILGPKIANPQDNNSNVKDNDDDGNGDSIKSNEGNEKSTQSRSLSQNENISPEIFLPEEWTY